ncbi:MAG: hypothetical protein KGH63_01915, partial [Candidatus Micrarchaeota archaeon]|nr:hypothetical protein [Candidatus Micrarchaeota archaeon]
MEEDVQRLYAANIRMSGEAYDYLLRHDLSRTALRLLLLSESPILTLDDVRAAMAESSKIPMPIPTRGPEASKDETPVSSSPANPSPSISPPQAHAPAYPSPNAPSPPPAHHAQSAGAPLSPSAPAARSSIIESGPMSGDMLTRPTMPPPSSYTAQSLRQGIAPPEPKNEFSHPPARAPSMPAAPTAPRTVAGPRPASEIMTDVPA